MLKQISVDQHYQHMLEKPKFKALIDNPELLVTQSWNYRIIGSGDRLTLLITDKIVKGKLYRLSLPITVEGDKGTVALRACYQYKPQVYTPVAKTEELKKALALDERGIVYDFEVVSDNLIAVKGRTRKVGSSIIRYFRRLVNVDEFMRTFVIKEVQHA